MLHLLISALRQVTTNFSGFYSEQEKMLYNSYEPPRVLMPIPILVNTSSQFEQWFLHILKVFLALVWLAF